MNDQNQQKVIRPDGSTFEPVMIQFMINPDQAICVVGIPHDLRDKKFQLDHIDGYRYDDIGFLSDVGFPMNQIIMNSLHLNKWDFSAWHDPRIIVINILTK